MSYINKLLNLKLIDLLNKSDIGKRILSGAFWAVSGVALSKCLILISGIFCAHILGSKEYGEFCMIRSTINMFVAFGTMGLGLTASKYISEYRVNNTDKIYSIYLITNVFTFIFGFITTLLIIIFASRIAINSLNSPSLTFDIKLGALLLFFTILNSAQVGVLSGLESFKTIAVNLFIATIIEILLLIIGAIYFSVSGAIIGMGIGFAFLFILNFISIHRKFSKLKIAYRYNNIGFNDFRVLYRFSLPAALASFLVGPVFWIVKAMLVRDTDFSQLGIYEVADQWKIIILFIPGALSQIILPMLSNIHGEGNSVSYKKVLKINMLLNTSICTFVSLIIILFSNIIMKLYGNGFDQPWPLIILAISTIFTSLSQVIGLSIASKGKMWHGFAFNSIWAALIILFSYIFITLGYGAVGLSLAVLISYIIHTIIQFIYIKIMIII